MNKADLIKEVAFATGMTKVKTNEVIDAIVNAIQNSLSKGEKVTLIGFGSWDVATRKERKGRNPKTGVEITIPEKKVARFKSGTKLGRLVNGEEVLDGENGVEEVL